MAAPPQPTWFVYLQGSEIEGGANAGEAQGSTASGPGQIQQVDGYLGAQQLEVVEMAGGTATLTIQGNMDGNPSGNWYSVGYQQVDNQATPTRAVTGISITAYSAHIYQILDPYRFIRVVLSSMTGGATVYARVYLVAM
jgi:hypothetical protein